VSKAFKEFAEIKDYRASRVSLVSKVSLVNRVFREFKASKVFKEIKATVGIKALAAKRERREIPVTEANKEFLVNAENAENKDQQLLTEPLDVMEQKAQQEREGIKVFLAEMVKTERAAKTG
jgi:hypothetical protein